MPHANRYPWFVPEDLNGFFGLMFDNLTVLSFLAGILIFGFHYPADIVYTRMFPGTAFGVLAGDVAYVFMARRMARRTGRRDITAMPLGLDTPSTLGIALVVLGPAFLAMKAKGMPEREAALMTWYLGMATMVLMGLLKTVCSFLGSSIQRLVPQAGLLGSLAGLGVALLGLLPLLDIFGMPLVGLVALGLIFTSLVAGIRMPGRIPGVLAAVLAGTALYYLAGPLGLVGLEHPVPPALHLHFGLPVPSLLFLRGLGPALTYLPLSVPFGLLTVVGGINVTESARVAGDDYRTRDILLVEALATILAGVCGGVAQSTPYIGHPAYKRMGARTGYALLTGLFIGLGGVFGYVSFFVELIPRAVLAPILTFVAMDIMVQSFLAVPRRHTWAVAFAFFPTLARTLAIKYGTPSILPAERFQELMREPGKSLPEMLVTVALGNGFILTAMLWGAFLAELIDRRLRRTALYLFLLAGLTFFGIIHSALPDGSMYLPWRLEAWARAVPYQFTLGYVALGLMVLALSFTRGSRADAGGLDLEAP